MKKTFIVFLLTLPALLFAQDFYLLNTLQNPMQFNPASTGLIHNNRIAIAGKTWLGFNSAPFTAQINYEKSMDSSAWGFGVLSLYEHFGFFDEEQLEGHLRYTIINKSNAKLSLGGALIYASSHLDPNWHIPEGSIENDPAIPNEFRMHAARFAIGSWFKNPWIDAGVSLYGNIHQFNQTPEGLKFFKRYTAYASAKVINRSSFRLRPDVSLIFEELNNNYILLYGINACFQEKYRAGIKMLNNKDLIPSIGVDYQNFSMDVFMVLQPELNYHINHAALQLSYSFDKILH